MPAPSRTKRQVVTEFRNAGILDAARRVFAARGFERASLDEIARRAGVAKGTVYLYYPSKDRLYRAALRHDLVALCGELSRRVAEPAALKDKVRAFVTAKLDYFERNRAFFRIYQAAFSEGRPIQFHKDFASLYRQQLALLESAFRKAGRRERRRGVTPAAAALAVSDLTKGAIQRRIFGPRKCASRRELELLVELAWKGVAGR